MPARFDLVKHCGHWRWSKIDLDMMAIAGLSIAFNAKPVVIQAADISINEPTLKKCAAPIGVL